ncbi:MAG: hypothetical protein HS127_10330 [Planctomycetia bacterium]|nr:hypothetical protein [Planctomycetia bacterium]
MISRSDMRGGLYGNDGMLENKEGDQYDGAQYLIHNAKGYFLCRVLSTEK